MYKDLKKYSHFAIIFLLLILTGINIYMVSSHKDTNKKSECYSECSNSNSNSNSKYMKNKGDNDEDLMKELKMPLASSKYPRKSSCGCR